MLRSYLTDRVLLTGEELAPRQIICGVQQGSVLGPALWNVFYDSLLGIDVPGGVHLVGFSDDLAVVGVDRTVQLIEDAVNLVLTAIDTWMSSKRSRASASLERGYLRGGHTLPLTCWSESIRLTLAKN